MTFRMSFLRAGAISALLSTFICATASACTVCDTTTGQQVRAGIFGDDFWSTLVAVASPFPVLLIVIGAYHFGSSNLRRLKPSAEASPTT